MPLIAWTIKAAQRSMIINYVYVTTEDPEIAEISKNYGAEVIDRPVELAQDNSGSEPVIQQFNTHWSICQTMAKKQTAYAYYNQHLRCEGISTLKKPIPVLEINRRTV